ncbi:prepilin-type cleavage/methylation domain-containing protein [Desulfobacter hydrogenophilus]|uniref:Prepilin-type N-terminal cleavage/methylation domain-containing protein n=1 Tax=Desulfobacter hydrogenophilus TaxID=2291 RepID=A0A328FI81_9BACT|nr:prepilin-type N-terminal cleavage/methylation domain-containing protein [Desulfobacter hydrogenophilus]NDY70866.1 prepilin-type N-terminal cleavage/methylation domain-containing protein [Desulfobacter hydrogenophilus]QBH11636.1 prepilin-type N-terminal cleavage/methylation domain-containing protein [Desulfobacter hydrogenophilus]RAM03182.1 prepilin-type cleavage/methylation domain-containing protein [Desulfobacter hydrogenophilus]
MLKHSGMPLQVSRTDYGFTLMELMVALVIFSFVMVMLFSSFNSFISTGQSIAHGVDYNERARDAFRRILDDLTNLYVPESRIISVQNSLDGQDVDTFQMTGSESSVGTETFSTLEFVCLSGLQTGRRRPSSVVRVTYYVRKNSRELFDLCRAERPIGSDRDTDPCLDPVLAENITRFTIDFVDAKLNEHQDWDGDKDTNTDRDGVSLPCVLNIGLTLKSENKEKIYETAVVLPVQGQTGG